jgi:5-methyltetrahydrofolate--homocysteine methyltransferase
MLRPVVVAQPALQALLEFLDEVENYCSEFIVGLSNVSYGLPRRNLLNAHALTTLWCKGIRHFILNVTETRIQESLSAARVLNGLDEGGLGYCRTYTG